MRRADERLDRRNAQARCAWSRSLLGVLLRGVGLRRLLLLWWTLALEELRGRWRCGWLSLMREVGVRRRLKRCTDGQICTVPRLERVIRPGCVVPDCNGQSGPGPQWDVGPWPQWEVPDRNGMW